MCSSPREARATLRGLPLAFVQRHLGDRPDPHAATILAQLLQASCEGHLCIRYQGPQLPGTIKDGNRLYLPRLWDAETRVVEHIPKNLSFITGGPGTGKTYAARKLIAGSHNVAIAAPTGKAASNFPGAKTLHALLQKPITADLVVVDEASMIDVDLMGRLFTAIKPEAHLVLVGDPAQLPPVEAGGLFADLVKALPDRVMELTRPMRAETDELIALAEAVRNGLWKEVERTDDPITYAKRHPEVTILTPLRSEVDRINAQLSFKPTPIMITKNDYSLNLFNGDMGHLHGETAHFGDRTLPAAILPAHTLAYCLSVHKSQGSEFDHVLFVAPSGSERFGRELVYTAVTRAKKKIAICASDETIQSMLNKHELRLSGLLDRLK